jgi:hypothetical protein
MRRRGSKTKPEDPYTSTLGMKRMVCVVTGGELLSTHASTWRQARAGWRVYFECMSRFVLCSILWHQACACVLAACLCEFAWCVHAWVGSFGVDAFAAWKDLKVLLRE